MSGTVAHNFVSIDGYSITILSANKRCGKVSENVMRKHIFDICLLCHCNSGMRAYW